MIWIKLKIECIKVECLNWKCARLKISLIEKRAASTYTSCLQHAKWVEIKAILLIYKRCRGTITNNVINPWPFCLYVPACQGPITEPKVKMKSSCKSRKKSKYLRFCCAFKNSNEILTNFDQKCLFSFLVSLSIIECRKLFHYPKVVFIKHLSKTKIIVLFDERKFKWAFLKGKLFKWKTWR